MNANEMIARAKTIPNGKSHCGISVRIIYTESSGRRLELSSGSLAVLGESKEVYITYIPEPTALILSAVSVCDHSQQYRLKKGNAIYCAAVLSEIVSAAKLDFENCSSRSYIAEKDKIGDTDVIVVRF